MSRLKAFLFCSAETSQCEKCCSTRDSSHLLSISLEDKRTNALKLPERDCKTDNRTSESATGIALELDQIVQLGCGHPHWRLFKNVTNICQEYR